jgi:hypothetical protein
MRPASQEPITSPKLENIIENPCQAARGPNHSELIVIPQPTEKMNQPIYLKKRHFSVWSAGCEPSLLILLPIAAISLVIPFSIIEMKQREPMKKKNPNSANLRHSSEVWPILSSNPLNKPKTNPTRQATPDSILNFLLFGILSMQAVLSPIQQIVRG